jgi:hypothetical protein
VAVIEWAERWLEVHSPQSIVHSPQSTDQGPRTTDHGPRTDHVSPLLRVRLEILSNTERRISYEDTGA